jgi:hypothetical protein
MPSSHRGARWTSRRSTVRYLADLARLTGGWVLELSQAGQLDDAIPIREVTRTIETRDELWGAPLLFATIVLALTAERVLRKIFRLI